MLAHVKYTFAFLLVLKGVSSEIRKFPKGFLLGAGTSAYQIEGAWNVSDKGVSIWDHYLHTQNPYGPGVNGDVACDSYNQYERDIQMVKELGVDFYRLSISWSRLFPTGFTNVSSQAGFNYYNNLIDRLLEEKVQPVVTIYHWDLPQKLQELGGWYSEAIQDYYLTYADAVFSAFGDRVKLWLTFNEPHLSCFLGYGNAAMAPGLLRQGIGEYKCGHNLLLAHAKAYRLYEAVYKHVQGGKVGLTMDSMWYEPASNTKQDKLAAKISMEFELGWFAHPIFSKFGDYPPLMKELIANKSLQQGFNQSRLPSFTKDEIENLKGASDFLGINHYSSCYAKYGYNQSEIKNYDYPSMHMFFGQRKPGSLASFAEDMGVMQYQDPAWPSGVSKMFRSYPQGFRKLLEYVKAEYDNPEVGIYENGFPDIEGFDDDGRIHYLNLYLNSLLDAVENGCDVRIYSVWSLMDNFEWASGYSVKFGLYHIDFNDTQRTATPRKSAGYYSNLVATKEIIKMKNYDSY